MRRAGLVLACLLLAGTARAEDLVVPGGARGLSAALGIPPLERARLLSELVRIVYAPPSGRFDSRVLQDRLIRYLDVLNRFQIELPLAQPRGTSLSLASIGERQDKRQAATLLETLGLKLVDRNRSLAVAPSADKDAGERAGLAAALGLDTKDIVTRLNGGEAVRLELPTEVVPAPIAPAEWERFSFGKNLPPDQLFGAIIRDRHAALVVAGLAALDDETLRYVRDTPRLLERIYTTHAAVFYAFGASLQIRNGRLSTPGGEGNAALWESVVGERATEPDRFIDALLGKSGGRLAYLYDAIAGLDAAHAAFALGLWIPDMTLRVERFRALASAIQGAYSSWDVEGRPSQRMANDAAMLLAIIRVSPDGAPQAPAWRLLWDRALGGADLPDEPERQLKRVKDDGPIDAAWIVEHVALGLESDRAEKIHAFAFGQRAFADVSEAGLPHVLVALRAMARYPMLMLTLDRMGITDPAVYAAAARLAVRLGEGSRRDMYNGLGQYQSAITLVAKLRRARVITPEQATTLVRDLVEPPDSAGAPVAFPVLGWITRTLAPAIGAAEDGLEGGLERALAGSRSAGSAPAVPTIVWEDRKYRVDVSAAELARLARMRERLGAPAIGDVATFAFAIESLAKGPADLEEATRLVGALAGSASVIRNVPIHPYGVEPLSDPVAVVSKSVARLKETLKKPRDLKRVPHLVEPLVPVAREALTDSLMALAYAVSLGSAQDLSGPGVNVARRHDFGFALTGGDETRRRIPWRMPTADPEPGKPWHVTGSLLGMDVGLALVRLRRVTDLLPEPPTINANEARTLARSIVLINPFDLEDRTRDEIVAALARGRDRIRGLAGRPDDLGALGVEAGLDTRRLREVAWVLREEPDTLLEYFSLAEVLIVGRPQAAIPLANWGAGSLPLNGCLCTAFEPPRWNSYTGRVSMGILAGRLADVNLRLAELTAEAGLPARILPDILDAAMQDLIDRVRMIDDDDWLTLVRAAGTISRERFDDLAAALTAAGGPLVPADTPVSKPQ
jgi:hypothetical protein